MSSARPLRLLVSLSVAALVLGTVACSEKPSDADDTGASQQRQDTSVDSGDDEADTAGDAQETSSACQSGSDCTSKEKPYCQSNGECAECLYDQHCASNQCDKDATPKVCVCVDVGSTCSGDDGCCSGNCDGGTCAEPCGQAGDACQSASDCCGNQCQDGTCGPTACKPEGASCSSDNPCCSGSCEGGSCAKTCAEEGEDCEDVDCCGELDCIGIGGTGGSSMTCHGN